MPAACYHLHSMPTAARSPSTVRRHSRWLLLLGLFALLVQVAAASGLMHRGSAGKGFVAELCTAGGLVSQSGGGESLPANAHDCCTLCGVSTPPLAAAALPIVAAVLLPTQAAPVYVSFSPRHFTWSTAPPRGPPAFS